ncbi:hypothetical protein, partial [Chitinimonas sp. BJB300]|uniref:hypothetical protein n=1 Tax=Chitinimonas sp. BJB300 TaxID=1559339 RepID=UPI001C8FFE66
IEARLAVVGPQQTQLKTLGTKKLIAILNRQVAGSGIHVNASLLLPQRSGAGSNTHCACRQTQLIT